MDAVKEKASEAACSSVADKAHEMLGVLKDKDADAGSAVMDKAKSARKLERLKASRNLGRLFGNRPCY